MINSINNKKMKLVKSLNKKKYRDKENKFVIEGSRFINEIPKEIKVVFTLVSESFKNKNDIDKYESVEIVGDDIFNKITDTKNTQGILAVCEKYKHKIDDLYNIKNDYVILGDKITDPGNLGTIIRTAEASGVDYIVLSKGCVDVYNQKVIRSTAGSVLNIPIIENVELEEVIKKLKNEDVKIIGSHLSSEKYHTDCNMKNKCGIVIGNEAKGMSDEITNLCDELVIIPMIGKVESLNASVASGILMYELIRQRGE